MNELMTVWSGAKLCAETLEGYFSKGIDAVPFMIHAIKMLH